MANGTCPYDVRTTDLGLKHPQLVTSGRSRQYVQRKREDFREH
jgi:hypothetical protein